MNFSMYEPNKKLVFENREVFFGRGFGADREKVCEVCTNTAMAGYQEIFSDCTNYEEFVCMTYPLIGNYGMAAEDYETRSPKIGGLIVKEYNNSLSNFRAAKTLSEEMLENGVPGIEGVDTRKISRMLHKQGTMRALLCAAEKPLEEALEEISKTPLVENAVAAVSCKKRWYSRTAGMLYSVVVIDCGTKLGIIDNLTKRHCNVTVLPHNASAEDVFALSPDGVVISSGPGNPAEAQNVVALIKELQGKIPLFGISLGHLLFALANGATTQAMPQAHIGGNYPVKTLENGKIEITAQGHSYMVNKESLGASKLQISHENVLDGSVEGLENKKDYAFSVQFNPESRPGPADANHLFDKFVDNMKAFKS